MEKFRRLPTPLLVLVVLARFIFGFGMGASLAAPRGSTWKPVGWTLMVLSVLLALAAGKDVLKD